MIESTVFGIFFVVILASVFAAMTSEGLGLGLMALGLVGIVVGPWAIGQILI